MQRWVLVRDGIVRCYMLTANEPDEAAKQALIFGDIHADAERDLDAEGSWQLAPPDAGLVGDGWTLGKDGRFSPPTDSEILPKLITGAEFLALFSAAEVAALWQSGPEFMVAALRIAAQNEVNLNSSDLGRLLALAVSRGALSAARLPRIAAGLPPA